MRLSPPISVLTIVAGVCALGGVVWLATPSSISVETSECYGTCPVFKLNASSSGTLTYLGKAYVTRSGIVSEDLATQRYDRFAATLNPLKPLVFANYSNDRTCPAGVSSDQPSVMLTWWKGPLPVRRFIYDYGCDTPRKLAIEAALAAGYESIEIERFIGTESERARHGQEWAKQLLPEPR